MQLKQSTPTCVGIPINGSNLKFIEAHDSLEAYITLEVLSLDKTPTGLQSHADSDSQRLQGNFTGLIFYQVIFIQLKLSNGNFNYSPDVVSVWLEGRVLLSFEILQS